jgi:hypothetical protein
MIFAILLWACSPDCDRTCQKLLTCDELEAPEMGEEECVSACNAQVNLYEDEEDEATQNALDDYKSCVIDSTCDELAAGVCYNEDIYSW